MYAHFKNGSFWGFFGGPTANRTEGIHTFVNLTPEQFQQVAQADNALPCYDVAAELLPDGSITIFPC